ncbi:beta-ketoacyl synthase chain length factor [Algoriella sp.]|uniref:beta-ketoacyl synthase chain length factor n=1 Tax=Algoriella sp. TaxID=1872434 RepID=UPI001B032153|nr:beta-ketoacyl synthase chain length factor [Algoriella sp.]MBO6211557.1 beta-ketoacyl synthase chain length factor [Algoriella sp.]
MGKVFINGLGFVNAQFIDEINEDFSELTAYITNAKLPILKEIISPAMSRRMASGVKMGIYAAKKALDEADINNPEAIITGTALGCLVDSEKFLTNIIQNNEEFLTPTAFIQSTHNTVGSQIALHHNCNAYNFTYTNGFNSFENALLDGYLQIEANEIENALVGGIDEIGDRTYQLQQLIGEISSDKNDEKKYSEGAHFFTLSKDKTENSYAELIDVFIQNEYQSTDLFSEILKFIELNNFNLSDIYAIIDGEDNLVDQLKSNDLINTIPVFYYKDFIGEYGTSSSFAMTLGCLLLKNKTLPKQFNLNDLESIEYRNVLLVNGHKGKDLSLVLLQSV